jgi:prepilin-type N-terminal cleavage/methylation domain-containing protein
MSRRLGFTLIELLVVIAIIATWQRSSSRFSLARGRKLSSPPA